MARRTRLVLPQRVDTLRKRISYWRKTKARRVSPMPVDLWEGAVSLARAHGIWPIAHALGLSYGSLKQQVEKRAKFQMSGVAASTSFVELWPGQPALTTGPVGDLVEITNAAGDKLAIHLAVGNRIDVAELAAAFVGRTA